jgi:hypothetical protein
MKDEEFEHFKERMNIALKCAEYIHKLASKFVDEKFPNLKNEDKAEMIQKMMDFLFELANEQGYESMRQVV